MAPTIHPPCTPKASCTPARCHPTPPPCKDPEKCLLTAINKGTMPCPSAVSILSTTAKLKCTECNKQSRKEPVKPEDKMQYIEEYLAQKKKEAMLLKIDRLTGSNRYAEYIREKNNPKKKRKKGKNEEEQVPCCQGKGHRGWLHPSKPGKKRKKGSKANKNSNDDKKKKSCTIL